MVSVIPRDAKDQPITFCDLINEIIAEENRDWYTDEEATDDEKKVEPFSKRFPFLHSLFGELFTEDGVLKAHKREQHLVASAAQILLEFKYLPLNGSLHVFKNHFRDKNNLFITSAVFYTDKFIYLCDGYHKDEDDSKAIALSGLKGQILLDATYQHQKNQYHRTFFDNPFWTSPHDKFLA